MQARADWSGKIGSRERGWQDDTTIGITVRDSGGQHPDEADALPKRVAVPVHTGPTRNGVLFFGEFASGSGNEERELDLEGVNDVKGRPTRPWEGGWGTFQEDEHNVGEGGDTIADVDAHVSNQIKTAGIVECDRGWSLDPCLIICTGTAFE